MLDRIDKEILEAQKERDAAVARLRALQARRDEAVAEAEAARLMETLSPDRVHALVRLHGLKAKAAMTPQPDKK